MQLSFKEIPKQRLIAYVILLGLLVYSCIILALSAGTFDTGDGVVHYFISRYSWHYPHLFLDMWGKPLFTLVSSPFSQFGLKGITFFNILCGLTASYLAYLIAEKLKIPFPYLAIIFTFSAPIYFSVVNSGLTEPMFSMVLLLCIWLALNEQYYLSVIVFSFLPFIRAEYVFVAPVFVLYYLLKRKYKTILLLPFGALIFSLIGYFSGKNFLWLITENPYSAANAQAYGNVRGNLLSYIGEYHLITGLAFLILIILGLLWLAGGRYLQKQNRQESNTYFTEELVLIFGGFASILICHTIVWAYGIFPTLGLLRYMSPLIPLAAIIALRGLQLINLLPELFKLKWLSVLISIGFAAAVLYSPYTLWYNVPFKLDTPDIVIKNAINWLKQSAYKDKKKYYNSNFITICLGVDHFDNTLRSDANFSDPKHPENDMPSGSVFIYDSHYSKDAGIDTLSLAKDSALVILKKFSAAENHTAYSGNASPVWIFQRK
jgi:hypothetical protein